MTRWNLVRVATAGRSILQARLLAGALIWCLLILAPQARAQAPSAVTLNAPSAVPIYYGSGVSLSWSQSYSSDFASYKVYRRTSAGVTADNGTPVATITMAGSTSVNDSTAVATVAPGTTYYYIVCVVNAAGQSTPSVEKSITLVNAPPTTVTLSQPSRYYTSVYLSWSQSYESDFASYKIYRHTSAGVTAANGTLIATITQAGSTSASDSTAPATPAPGTTYFYVVQVVDSLGQTSTSNEQSILMLSEASSTPTPGPTPGSTPDPSPTPGSTPGSTPDPSPTPGSTPTSSPTPTPSPESSYQPDAIIRSANGEEPLGDGAYNSDGLGQTLSDGTVPGHKITCIVTLENDGQADDLLKVTGATRSGGWSIQYFDQAKAGSNISAAVGGAGWSVPQALAPRGSREIRVEATPDLGASTTDAPTIPITVASGSSSKQDVVKLALRFQKLAGIEYSVDAEQTWQPAPQGAGFISVELNQGISFRAVKANPNTEWPHVPDHYVVQWKGSHFEHLGELTSVMFETLTPAGALETITADGGNTMSVRVQVLAAPVE